MRLQLKVVSVGLLLILSLIAAGIIYKIQYSNKQIACEYVAKQVKNTILQANEVFQQSGGIAVTELDFPSTLRYEIYNKSGIIYLYIDNCKKTYTIAQNITIPEGEIINRKKVWLFVSPTYSVLSGNLSKVYKYLNTNTSFSCIFCSGKCCKIGGTYKCFSGDECCKNSDCNLPACTAAGGTPECINGYCSCKCPGDLYWNGTACINRPGYKYCNPSVPLPSKWDWRDVDGRNYVTPVPDQKNCGSCWAFATIGAMESDYLVENNLTGVSISLSVQNLISPGCGVGGSCIGGNPILALNYIETVGVVNSTCFPYTSGSCLVGSTCCSSCSCSVGCAHPCSCSISCTSPKRWRISTYFLVNPTIDAIKRALLCYGPLIVSSTNWSHSVVLVGYNDHSNICHSHYGKWGCWIIKNSWGLINGWWPPTGVCPGKDYCVWHKNGYAYIPYSGHPFSDLKNYVLAIKNVIPPK